MAKRLGFEVDLELHPARGEEEPRLSGRMAFVLGGERYGFTLAPVEPDDAQKAIVAFGLEIKKLVRGEPHALGGPVPDWWPHERELALEILEDQDMFSPDDHEHELADDPDALVGMTTEEVEATRISSCCQAAVEIVGGRGDFAGDNAAVTVHAKCRACGEPCDLVVPVP